MGCTTSKLCLLFSVPENFTFLGRCKLEGYETQVDVLAPCGLYIRVKYNEVMCKCTDVQMSYTYEFDLRTWLVSLEEFNARLKVNDKEHVILPDPRYCSCVYRSSEGDLFKVNRIGPIGACTKEYLAMKVAEDIVWKARITFKDGIPTNLTKAILRSVRAHRRE